MTSTDTPAELDLTYVHTATASAIRTVRSDSGTRFRLATLVVEATFPAGLDGPGETPCALTVDEWLDGYIEGRVLDETFPFSTSGTYMVTHLFRALSAATGGALRSLVLREGDNAWTAKPVPS